MALKLKTFIG